MREFCSNAVSYQINCYRLGRCIGSLIPLPGLCNGKLCYLRQRPVYDLTRRRVKDYTVVTRDFLCSLLIYLVCILIARRTVLLQILPLSVCPVPGKGILYFRPLHFIGSNRGFIHLALRSRIPVQFDDSCRRHKVTCGISVSVSRNDPDFLYRNAGLTLLNVGHIDLADVRTQNIRIVDRNLNIIRMIISARNSVGLFMEIIGLSKLQRSCFQFNLLILRALGKRTQCNDLRLFCADPFRNSRRFIILLC